MIDRLVRAGAQGVVLGCTEIELLIGAEDSPVPVFSTTRLHVEAAVASALEGVPTGCTPHRPVRHRGAWMIALC